MHEVMSGRSTSGPAAGRWLVVKNTHQWFGLVNWKRLDHGKSRGKLISKKNWQPKVSPDNARITMVFIFGMGKNNGKTNGNGIYHHCGIMMWPWNSWSPEVLLKAAVEELGLVGEPNFGRANWSWDYDFIVKENFGKRLWLYVHIFLYTYISCI